MENNKHYLPEGWERLSIDELISTIKNERRWFKRTLGIHYYHDYMCAQFDTKRGIKWTLAKTAEKLGMSKGGVSEAINLAIVITKIPNAPFLTREEALIKMREMKSK